MATITKDETFDRTQIMLVNEWGLAKRPDSDVLLGAGGLGKSKVQIQALELPIENVYFVDVSANVDPIALGKATDVLDLSKKIWAGIPGKNQG